MNKKKSAASQASNTKFKNSFGSCTLDKTANDTKTEWFTAASDVFLEFMFFFTKQNIKYVRDRLPEKKIDRPYPDGQIITRSYMLLG